MYVHINVGVRVYGHVYILVRFFVATLIILNYSSPAVAPKHRPFLTNKQVTQKE